MSSSTGNPVSADGTGARSGGSPSAGGNGALSGGSPSADGTGAFAGGSPSADGNGALSGGSPSADGNPFLQQRELLAGRAIVPLPDRGVVTVTGPDRLSWLDSLTSQSLTSLAPGVSTESLLLDPTGRVEHAMRIVDDGETTWLLVDAAPELAAWLDRMRFMLRVEVADRSADFVTVGAFGSGPAAPAAPSAPAAPATRSAPVAPATPSAPVASAAPAAPATPLAPATPITWVDPWPEVAPGGHAYGAAPDADWNYREILLPRDTDLTGYALASEAALDALRIAAHRPRLATEGDERTIPHELDWLRSAVHLNKGCYRGQETVAKVHNLGHPPRRIVQLHLDGLLPAPGDEVLLGDAVVGRVTSAAQHHELGPIALAVIKRSVDPAADLVVRTAENGDIAAAQEVIVPPSAGAEANVPRLPRLGAVTR